MGGGHGSAPGCLANLFDLGFGPLEVSLRREGARERRAEVTARVGFVLCEGADGASGQLDVG